MKKSLRVFLYDKKFCYFLSYKPLRVGCAARGEEVSCFATPLAREEFAYKLFDLKKGE